MRRMTFAASFASIFLCALCLPTVAAGQEGASIVGVVQDPSGAVLPGRDG